MSETARSNGFGNPERNFRLWELFLILLCLSSAAISVNLFWTDINQTINSRNDSKPIGTISIKDNNVQRRLGDRVLWGRLAIESPVYLGDLVRVAELSGATLNIGNTFINLGENTLIRVQQDPEREGIFRIELSQGSMDLSSGGTGITLDIMGKQVHVAPGSVLNASAGETGMVIQVSEGTVSVIEEEGETRELTTGMMVAADTEGREVIIPAVVVIRPKQTARFINSEPGPFKIDFAWSRINLTENDALQMEIARDRNYANVVQNINDLGDRAEINLDTGTWYWRILFKDELLSSGRISIADGSGPELINPMTGEQINYVTDLPQLRFQWSEKPGASSYILEVADTPDFINPVISRQTGTASLIDSSLTKGIWYWRVKPVFPVAFEGSSVFSAAASFHIEQSSEKVELVWPEPAVIEVEPEPEPPAPPPRPIPAVVPVVVPPPPIVEIEEEIPETPPETPVEEPPMPLEAPRDLQPRRGFRIGIEELKVKRSIDFEWSSVPGADAYIFTLSRKTDTEPELIIRTDPIENTKWTLESINILETGTFIWQVEAIRLNEDGSVGQQGLAGENTFILDIPLPSQPRVRVE